MDTMQPPEETPSSLCTLIQHDSPAPDLMDILYLLIPLSLVFVVVIAYAFLWAVKSGQFEDMEGPAHRILMDDEPASLMAESAAQGKSDNNVH